MFDYDSFSIWAGVAGFAVALCFFVWAAAGHMAAFTQKDVDKLRKEMGHD